MDPDDNMNYQITFDVVEYDEAEYTVSNVDIGNYSINVTSDDSFDFILNTKSQYDNTFSVVPEKDNPSIYTSFEQREQHDRYPALKKAWEDYLNMYNLTQGDPPIVE
jgi:hypothetical protein